MSNFKPIAIGVRDLFAGPAGEYDFPQWDVVLKAEVDGETRHYYSEDVWFDEMEGAEAYVEKMRAAHFDFDDWSDKACEEDTVEGVNWISL